jgi:hypothetical protein
MVAAISATPMRVKTACRSMNEVGSLPSRLRVADQTSAVPMTDSASADSSSIQSIRRSTESRAMSLPQVPRSGV